MKLPPVHQRIVTAEEMAALDRATIQGAWGRAAVPSLKLMERAGLEASKAIVTWWRERDGSPVGPSGAAAAAKGKRPGAGAGARGGAAAAMRRFTGGGPVVILCGRGNNGGDGFVAARHLKAAGFAVRVVVAAAEGDLSPDARVNHLACEKARIPVTFLPEPRAWGEGSESENAIGGASFLVDALLGTGSKGAPRGAVAAAIECALRSEKPIVAIDLPSGVDATTGHAESPCIRAEMTVTLALPKAGLALEPGRERAGRLVVVDIGISREVIVGQRPSHLLVSAEWARPLLPVRAADAHKGTVGRVLFVGGSAGMMGAVALATESAYRAGAGYVVACVPASCVDSLEARVAEVVKRGVAETGARTLAAGAGDAILAEAMRADVVVLGPGLSRHPESEALARALLELLDGPVILDADGLNAFEGRPLRRARGPLIVTPHYGEAARLSGKSIADVARDPAAWARKFAADSGAIVCLKSVPMMTVAPGEPVLVNATGNPGMATAGAGDVLSGTIAGLLAQGMDPPEAAAVGCFTHGLAGDVAVRRKGRRGLMAGDIRDALPAALLALESGALDDAE
ncbi:MAG TPA: NAD(P)H-hydrate dehydratase [Candidatus Eisenbacteria bacterium]|nr:NAD(P)H-hydrate dehydratase [Candidatus Eisenbacteria bacterium]